jgi:hypothetical protein
MRNSKQVRLKTSRMMERQIPSWRRRSFVSSGKASCCRNPADAAVPARDAWAPLCVNVGEYRENGSHQLFALQSHKRPVSLQSYPPTAPILRVHLLPVSSSPEPANCLRAQRSVASPSVCPFPSSGTILCAATTHYNRCIDHRIHLLLNGPSV